MKIKEACKKQGCRKDMYCFGGADETLDHMLCNDVLMVLLNDIIKNGIISKKDLERISETKRMTEEKLKGVEMELECSHKPTMSLAEIRKEGTSCGPHGPHILCVLPMVVKDKCPPCEFLGYCHKCGKAVW